MIDVPRGVAAAASVNRIAVRQRKQVRQAVIPAAFGQLLFRESSALIGTEERRRWKVLSHEHAQPMNAAVGNLQERGTGAHTRKLRVSIDDCRK